MENVCTTSITGVARLVHLLKIEGFSTTVTMKSKESIRSRWHICGFDWEIRVYPTAEFSGYHYPAVALQLVFLGGSRGSCSRANLGCQVIDPTGKIMPSEENSVMKRFHRPKQHSDLLKLMFREGPGGLAASGYLKDDTLTVRCTITVADDIPIPTIAAATEEIVLPSTNFHQQFGELLRSGTGADVTFVVSGESFPAHKLILSARSPVFMAEFFGQMKEKCSEHVEVKDMDRAVFKAMLHFIYTDTVPELDQRLEEVTTMAQHLLVAADRYGLDRLKRICEGKLSGGISVDTAATTLALAEQHNCSQLKAKCAEFIVSTPAVLDAVLATEGYKHLATSCPSVLADLLKSSLRVGGRTDA
ncbi:BTB/POZ and MATH domain-containing protein 2-like [Lolium perenne]|uniref:BTB/POZ and MATH domain-containing protein 2-like n=1 Tax=Lolium perenne TaxID=4522 RepID=UPI0021EAB85B|nr:BTB/POZ and MATH domain-containing protein 2-like [Lolium perenne]